MTNFSEVRFCACATLLSAGFVVAGDAKAIDRDHVRIVNTVFVNETNYKLAMTAENVTVCDLTSDPLWTRPPNAKATYVEGKWRDVPPDVLGALREELRNPRAYVLPMGSDKQARGGTGCLPDYGVRFQFASEAKSLELNFCFGCGDIALSRGGKIFHEASFRIRDAKFLDVCLGLFPENEHLKRFALQQRNQ